MTNQDRWTYYESGELQRGVAIELLDWAGYWSTTGIDGIVDPLQKEQMRWAINMILKDLSFMIKVVSNLAMSESVIKDAVHPTEANISTAVTSIMTYKLAWITNIYELPESEE